MRIAAAPLAAVLLVLSAVVVWMAHLSTGLPVAIASRSPCPTGGCADDRRVIVIRIDSNRNLFINSEPTTRDALQPRLREIFSTRAERVAFVRAESGLTYGDVADLIATVRPIVQNIGLLTPSAEATETESILRAAFPVKSRWD